MAGEDDLVIGITAQFDEAKVRLESFVAAASDGLARVSADGVVAARSIEEMEKEITELAKSGVDVEGLKTRVAGMRAEFDAAIESVKANAKTHAELNAKIRETTKAQEEVVVVQEKVAETVVKVKTRLEELGEATDKALAKGPSGVKSAQLALDELEEELKRNGETWRAAGEDVGLYTAKLEEGRQKNAESIQKIDEATKAVAAQKKGFEDFGQSLGIPVNKLALMALGLNAVRDAGQALKKELPELSQQIGLGAAEQEQFAGALDRTADIMQGRFVTAIAKAVRAYADFFSANEGMTGSLDKVSDAIREEAERLGINIAVAEKLIGARQEHRAEIEKEVAAYEVLIAAEREHGGIQKETVTEVTALIEKYGEELPATFRTLADSIGAIEPETKKATEAVDDLGKKTKEAMPEVAKQTKEAAAEARKLKEELEGAAAAAQKAFQAAQESEAGSAQNLEQIKARRAELGAKGSLTSDEINELNDLTVKQFNAEQDLAKAHSLATDKAIDLDRANRNLATGVGTLADTFGSANTAIEDWAGTALEFNAAMDQSAAAIAANNGELLDYSNTTEIVGGRTAELADSLHEIGDRLQANAGGATAAEKELADLADTTGQSAEQMESLAETSAGAADELGGMKEAAEAGKESVKTLGDEFEGLDSHLDVTISKVKELRAELASLGQ